MKSRRRLSRKLLERLPEKPRLALMRKGAKLKHEWPSPSLEIKIAETETELSNAYRLLHDSYVQSGLMNPEPSGMRVLSQHLLPQTTTIVAKWEGQVIGTLSLIRDNPFGLPMEKIFDVSSRRVNGRRLAEVSSLAIDPKFRGQSTQALFPLFRFVYQYAKFYFATHEFVIAVNPSMADMYLAFMCFKKLDADAKSYGFVRGAPAIGLYLNLETAADQFREAFAHRPLSQNYHKYFTEIPTEAANCLPTRHYHTATDPILTPRLLKEFFLDKAQLAHKLNFYEIQVLTSLYPSGDYQNLLQALQNNLIRKNNRIETQMKGELGSEKIAGEVWNVSADGLLVRTEAGALSLRQKSRIAVWLNESEVTNFEVEVRWSDQARLYGLRILKPSLEWLRMIKVLEANHEKAHLQTFLIA